MDVFFQIIFAKRFSICSPQICGFVFRVFAFMVYFLANKTFCWAGDAINGNELFISHTFARLNMPRWCGVLPPGYERTTTLQALCISTTTGIKSGIRFDFIGSPPLPQFSVIKNQYSALALPQFMNNSTEFSFVLSQRPLARYADY